MRLFLTAFIQVAFVAANILVEGAGVWNGRFEFWDKLAVDAQCKKDSHRV